MLAKFGLVLLVLVFGALAFSAGTTAPGALTQPVTQAVQAVKQLAAKLAPADSKPSTTTPAAAAPAAGTAPVATAAPASTPSSATTATAPATPASAADTSTPMGSTLLPTLPPATASYALQAGQFASSQAADQLSASLRGQGMTSTVITIRDINGTYWSVVTLGQFDSADQALSQRLYLSNRLGLPQYLPAILLPPPPKPPS